LAADETTKHIKVYLVSPDEDGALEEDSGLPKKPRAIVEVELDGAYLLTEAEMPDSKKIKLFEHFIEDVKEVLV
jgi:type II restriction enzyme